GNSRELGASALRELAHFLLFAEELNDGTKGTTVNVTTASDGSARNVIAEQAECGLDIRVLRMDEAARIDDSLKSYNAYDDRVEIKVEGERNRPPLERTDANQVLFEHAAKFGERL